MLESLHAGTEMCERRQRPSRPGAQAQRLPDLSPSANTSLSGRRATPCGSTGRTRESTLRSGPVTAGPPTCGPLGLTSGRKSKEAANAQPPPGHSPEASRATAAISSPGFMPEGKGQGQTATIVPNRVTRQGLPGCHSLPTPLARGATSVRACKNEAA